MKRNYMVGYKVFFGLLGFSALVTEIATIAAGGNWNPMNFFSYFTNGQVFVIYIIIMIGGCMLAFVVSRIGVPMQTTTSRKK